MRHRKKLSRKRAKRTFQKGNRVKKANLRARPMRGGFRL